MKKNFVSIKQIEQVFEARRKRNEQSRLNYYKVQTQKYLDKVDPESWLVDKYVRKYEKYKIANANKCERDKASAIAAFKKQIQQGIEANKKGSRTIKIAKNTKEKNIGKSKAKEEFQLWAKISKADENGLVIEITTGNKVHWRETQGGHYISASINATCFDENNVRPQFPWSNEAMSRGDKRALDIKEQYRNNLIKMIGIDEVERLERAEKERGSQISSSSFGRSYFKEIYEKYKALNDAIFAAHPNWSRKASEDQSWKKRQASQS